MKAARILLSWDLSVSPDVVEQLLDIKVDGEIIAQESLPSTLQDFEFIAPEFARVEVNLTASDGTNLSDVSTLSFIVPDLEKPSAITNLGWTIVEVINIKKSKT